MSTADSRLLAASRAFVSDASGGYPVRASVLTNRYSYDIIIQLTAQKAGIYEKTE